MKHRRILFVGYGAIAQALTPVLFDRYPDLDPNKVAAITADEGGIGIARAFGIGFRVAPITPENLDTTLAGRLDPGDILLNLSVEVSSLALIDWCQAHGVLYLDTCIEPWAGGYDPAHSSLLETTNYWLRRQALSRKGRGRPTCVIAHGANPGLVSHFVKLALARLAEREGVNPELPPAALARALAIRTIHIAERDTQLDGIGLREGEFANTWSVDGLMAEAMQRAELAWGTHETALPPGAVRHEEAATAGLVLATPGAGTRVRSWAPSIGEQRAWLITHHEALSIGEWLTEFHVDGFNAGPIAYRPTVYYAYCPAAKTCDSLARWADKDFQPPALKTVMRDALVSGSDELGVLLISDRTTYWFGSVLSLQEARWIAPHNNATSMQVVGGIVGALEWMLRNPCEGVVEAEDMDSDSVMREARPYLGEIVGVETDWPGEGRVWQTKDFLEQE